MYSLAFHQSLSLALLNDSFGLRWALATRPLQCYHSSIKIKHTLVNAEKSTADAANANLIECIAYSLCSVNDYLHIYQRSINYNFMSSLSKLSLISITIATSQFKMSRSNFHPWISLYRMATTMISLCVIAFPVKIKFNCIYNKSIHGPSSVPSEPRGWWQWLKTSRG